MKNTKKAIVVSASSDIGTALCRRWAAQGWFVAGTYRTPSAAVAELAAAKMPLVSCELADPASIDKACQALAAAAGPWDVLVMCPGSLDPVGPFSSTDFDAWAESIGVNFTNQLRVVHALLPARNTSSTLGPCVLFFAGGGSNRATLNYSAYTVSKIALTKMCELLDAELPDTRFAIVGPGWVKTKIHEATVKAGDRAGDNLQKTQARYSSGEWSSMEDVVECCGWIVNSSRRIVGGRNFSVVFDPWGTGPLERALEEDDEMYKLRRHGNSSFEKRS